MELQQRIVFVRLACTKACKGICLASLHGSLHWLPATRTCGGCLHGHLQLLPAAATFNSRLPVTAAAYRACCLQHKCCTDCTYDNNYSYHLVYIPCTASIYSYLAEQKTYIFAMHALVKIFISFSIVCIYMAWLVTNGCVTVVF